MSDQIRIAASQAAMAVQMINKILDNTIKMTENAKTVQKIPTTQKDSIHSIDIKA